VTRLAIFAAMTWECRPIVERLGSAQRTALDSATIWRRAREHDEIWVVKTGIGIERAANVARSVLGQTRFDLVVSTGCAGALSPDLDVGDLVIASRIVAPQDGTCIETAADAGARARNIAVGAGLRVALGPVVCNPTVLPTAAAKRAVGATHAAIAVDMESAPIAACAAAQGVPFLSARAILDRVDTELPPASLVAPDGHIRTLAMARRVATHPGDLVRLWALRGMTVTAQQTLRTFFAAWMGRDACAGPTRAPTPTR
jgi:adenosylhomocysteine nucleosidase